MLVTLENFKKYLGIHQFTFSDTPQIILIQGANGLGKSTVLRAISWCLYNKERRTYPWTMKNTKKSSVKIELNGRSIHRQKNPERITVVDNDITLTGDPAEQWILQTYGDYELWQASSYLPQFQHNILMQGTNTDRLALLEKWIFPLDPPGALIATIQDRRKTAEDKLTKAQAVLAHVQQSMSPEPTCSRPPEGMTTDLAKQQLEEVRTAMRSQDAYAAWLAVDEENQQRLKDTSELLCEDWPTMCTMMAKWHEAITEHRQITALKVGSVRPPSDLEKHARTVEERIAWVDQHLGDEFSLTAMTDWRDRTNTVITTVHHVARLKTLMATNPPRPTISRPAANDIQLAKRQQEAYDAWIKGCRDLGLDPEEAVIIKSQVSRYVSVLPGLNAYRSWKALRSQTLPPCMVTVAEATEKYQQALQAQTVMICPCCEVPVRLVNKSLMKASRLPPSSEELSRLLQQLELAKQHDHHHQSLSSNQTAWQPYSTSDLEWALTLTWKPEWTTRLPSLIPAEPPVIMYDALIAAEAWYVRQEELDQLLGMNLDLDEPMMTTPIAKVQLLHSRLVEMTDAWLEPLPWTSEELAAWKKIETYETRWAGWTITEEAFANFKSAYEAQLQTRARYDECTRAANAWRANQPSVPHITMSIEEAEHIWEQTLQWAPWQHEQEHLALVTKQAVDAEKVFGQWVKLLEEARLLEYSKLEEMITPFNQLLNQFLTDVFEHPIMLFLDLFKGDRPNIQWTMIYKGSENESISDLSGGEQKCISLAITLCLSINTPFNFIFLDECFVGVDAEIREKCLELIRTVVPHKTVVVVGHEQIEGQYDHTLNFF